MTPIIFIAGGAILVIAMLAIALSGPSTAKIASKRLTAVKDRHSGSLNAGIEAQMRKVVATRQKTRMDGVAARILPNPKLLQARIARTGKPWRLSQYMIASAVIFAVVFGLAMLQGLGLLLSLFLGLLMGLALPYVYIGMLISKRIKKFNARFPDAIELLVRGLRAGLPISETLGIVSSEIPGPVGEEFQAVTDKIRIGRTMDAALQETADRLGTPEFQFFTITLAIQRETGGNLAETLMNLAEVLRKRAQMKLKIKAMSSESKASAMIIGALPFIVFALIYWISPTYMGGFFVDQRLIVIGLGGMVWMAIGAGIMAKMVNFEI